MARLGGEIVIVGSGNLTKCNPAGALHVSIVESLISFTADYSGAENNTVIITPASGKKLSITGVYVSTESITVDVLLDFAVSGNIVLKLYTANKQSQAGIPCNYKGAKDESLRITCGANTFVCVSYFELI